MANEPNAVIPNENPPKAAPVSNGNGFNARRKQQLRIGLIVGTIVFAFVFGGWRIYSAGHVSTDDAQVAGHIIVISAKATGFIKNVYVLDNQEVQAGQLLAEIDDRDYQVRLAQAEADLAVARATARASSTQVSVTSQTTTSLVDQARAGVTSARAGVETAEKDLEQTRAMLRAAEADVVAARSNLKRTQDDVTRYRKLAAKEEIPRQTLEAAENGEVAAQASVTSSVQNEQAARAKVAWAEARVTQAKAQINDSQARLIGAETAPAQVSISQSQASTAEAKVKRAEADVESRRLELSYTKIYAPLHGVVSKKSVEIGQNVAIGQPLMALVPLDDVWVVANFKETQLKNVRAGQSADVDVDTYSGKTFHGKVDSVAAGTGAVFSLLPPENATGNYVKVVQRIPVKILLTEQKPGEVLRPGMNVVVTIHTR
ncbi:MAG: HlyD family secretion protein [Acidobacteriia bacterium]|nr:HlyD family secretion protein [Terriglobia bacterium]